MRGHKQRIAGHPDETESAPNPLESGGSRHLGFDTIR